MACGSSDDNGSDASLSDLLGVWDVSTTYPEGTDEWYIVIKPSGIIVNYDYMGDTIDNGPNCYEQFDYTLVDLGGGAFVLTDDFGGSDNINVTFSGDSFSAVTTFT